MEKELEIPVMEHRYRFGHVFILKRWEWRVVGSCVPYSRPSNRPMQHYIDGEPVDAGLYFKRLRDPLLAPEFWWDTAPKAD